MIELAADPFRTVYPTDAIANDTVLPYYLNDRKLRISLARVDGRLYAFDDLCTCTDKPCPLSGGLLTGTTLMCQCHGSRFDLATGAVINGPATKPLHAYEVQEVEGHIQIRVSPTDHIRTDGHDGRLPDDGRQTSGTVVQDVQHAHTRLAPRAILILVLFAIIVAALRQRHT